MFQGFAKVWTPVLASAIVRDKPISVRLAGENLVVFRTREGVAALLDRCPHRGVALSKGRVQDGCIECPFHGWKFQGDGQVAHVPWSGRLNKDRLRTMAMPAFEAGGLIWVFTAPDVDMPSPPALALRLTRRRSVVDESLFSTHWTRAIENAMDAPHLPFVHSRSIGAFMRRPARTGAVMRTHFTPEAHGGRIDWSVDGATQGHLQGAIDFFAPNVMRLRFPGNEGFEPTQLMAVVPVDERTTRMMTILKPGASVFRLMSALIGRRILREDQRVVESSDPPEVPPAGTELSVASDAGVLAFRRYYDQTLRGSSAEPRAGVSVVTAQRLQEGG